MSKAVESVLAELAIENINLRLENAELIEQIKSEIESNKNNDVGEIILEEKE